MNLKVDLEINNKIITYVLHLGANVNEDEDYEEDEGPLDPHVDWSILKDGNYRLTDNQPFRHEIDEDMAWELISDLGLEYSIEHHFLTIHEQDN
jgi:hypothetical protein